VCDSSVICAMPPWRNTQVRGMTVGSDAMQAHEICFV
jgi:hypothetical protein